MKCPKCGREIEDGSLFCKYCFADIRVVPTYDEKVEHEISETMDKVSSEVDLEAAREERSQKLREEKQQRQKKLRIILTSVLGTLAVVMVVLGILYLRERNSPAWYLSLAYEDAAAGRYSEAADAITQAQQLQEDADPQLMLQKSEYLEQAGRREEALATAKLVVASQDPDSEYTVNAYGRMIDIYAQDNEYDKIISLLEDSDNAKVQEVFRQYLVYTPTMTPAAGSYPAAVTVTIRCEGEGSIFYTTDGTEPGTDSILYSEPIPVTSGTVTIRAVSINPFGQAGNVITRTYTIREE